VGRLIVSVPHAGTFIPEAIRRRLNPVGQQVIDTDWHVDRLYEFVPQLGATLLVATHARTVVDLNRDPGGTRLYPGQAETTICPTEAFGGASLYTNEPPGAAEITERVTTYWQPYHDTLRQELERIRALHGSARLLDAHSIRQSVPRLFPGKLPDLNFGTNGGAAASPALVAKARAAAEGSGFSQVLDGRFRGGHITRHYGDPARGVEAIQLELAQATYMNEDAPHPYDPDRAAPLIAVLQRLVATLVGA